MAIDYGLRAANSWAVVPRNPDGEFIIREVRGPVRSNQLGRYSHFAILLSTGHDTELGVPVRRTTRGLTKKAAFKEAQAICRVYNRAAQRLKLAWMGYCQQPA